MNSKILELAKKAKIDISHIEKHSDSFFEESLNDFVRLLIKEAISVGSQAELIGEVWWSDAVLEHFGVKK